MVLVQVAVLFAVDLMVLMIDWAVLVLELEAFKLDSMLLVVILVADSVMVGV